MRKWTSQGVLTVTKALLWSSHGVLSRSYGVFVGDCLRSHGSSTAGTALSPATFNCADSVCIHFAMQCKRISSIRLHCIAKCIHTSSPCMFVLKQLKSCTQKVEEGRERKMPTTSRGKSTAIAASRNKSIVTSVHAHGGDLNVLLWRSNCPLRFFQNAEPQHLFCACPKCAPSLGVLCDSDRYTGNATALLR